MTKEARKQIAEAVAKEREACAKIVDDFPDYYDNNAEVGEKIAAAIRSRK